MIAVSKIRSIIATAALGALTVLMGITGVGMIPLPTVSITIMHIPVIIGAILLGPWSGAGVGLIMGVYALVRASTSPVGVLDPFFVNPFVSVLPRILLGVVSWAFYAGIKRCCVHFKRMKEYPAIIGSAFLGTLAHTVFVMAALMIVKAIDLKLAIAITLGNGIPESLGAIVVTTAVIAAWRGIDGHQKKSSLADIDEE